MYTRHTRFLNDPVKTARNGLRQRPWELRTNLRDPVISKISCQRYLPAIIATTMTTTRRRTQLRIINNQYFSMSVNLTVRRDSPTIGLMMSERSTRVRDGNHRVNIRWFAMTKLIVAKSLGERYLHLEISSKSRREFFPWLQLGKIQIISTLLLACAYNATANHLDHLDHLDHSSRLARNEINRAASQLARLTRGNTEYPSRCSKLFYRWKSIGRPASALVTFAAQNGAPRAREQKTTPRARARFLLAPQDAAVAAIPPTAAWPAQHAYPSSFKLNIFAQDNRHLPPSSDVCTRENARTHRENSSGV